MKETKVVKIPAKTIVKEATTKKVVRVTCDICGKSVDISLDNRYGSGTSKCYLCGRDVCRNTKSGRYGDSTCYIMYDNNSDYWDRYCIICYPLLIPARDAMKERHWQEEEDLEAAIKKESLNVNIQSKDS